MRFLQDIGSDSALEGDQGVIFPLITVAGARWEVNFMVYESGCAVRLLFMC